MSVCGRVAFGGSDATTMATPEPEGNRRPGLFPRLLFRLPGCACCSWQKSSSGLAPAWFANRRRSVQRKGANRSALQQRFDSLVEFLERGLALDHLAVDEEGRRRIDLQ